MAAPSAVTQVETLLRPLVREVMGWVSPSAPPDLLADDLSLTLCRELARQSTTCSDKPLTSLYELAIIGDGEHPDERTVQDFPCLSVSPTFQRFALEHHFLLRTSLLCQDLWARWKQPRADLLGVVFEQVVALVENETNSSRQRKLGMHFTPPKLAQTLTDRVLKEAYDASQASPEDTLTVIDPCLGGGAFWLASVRWAQKTLKLSGATLQRWPINRLYGLDLCRLSGEVSILTLRLELGADLAFHHAMTSQFRCADALAVLPQACWDVCWSAVLSNPPWGLSPVSSLTDADDKSKIFKATKGNLMESFIRSSLTLNEAGCQSFGLILPSKVLEQAAFTSLREELLDHGLHVAVDLGKHFFPSITESAALLAGRLGVDSSEIELGFLSHNCTPRLIAKHSRVELLARPDKTLRLPPRVELTRPGFSKLSELTDVTDSGIDYSTAEMGRHILYESNAPDSANDMRALRGRDIHPFHIKPSNMWLRHDWRERRQILRQEHPKVKAKINERVYQRSPKILVRQTGATLIAAIDWRASAHQRSLLAICEDNVATLQIVLFILNHGWTSSNLQELSHQARRDFAQLKTGVLKDLPIPHWDDSEARQLQEMMGQDLTKALVIDQDCLRLARQWVESLYLRRGYRPRASGEAS